MIRLPVDAIHMKKKVSKSKKTLTGINFALRKRTTNERIERIKTV